MAAGLAGAHLQLGRLVGFAAQTGGVDAADALLYAGLFFWTLGYDTIYALQDKDDDALIGVKSTALLFGARARDWVLGGFYAAAFALVLAAGFAAHAGWPFGFVMILAGGHLLWQVHTLKIEDPRAASSCSAPTATPGR
ncbi:MAG: UbiA family prenyltransferase [Rhizomicrobium sp.]